MPESTETSTTDINASHQPKVTLQLLKGNKTIYPIRTK